MVCSDKIIKGGDVVNSNSEPYKVTASNDSPVTIDVKFL